MMYVVEQIGCSEKGFMHMCRVGGMQSAPRLLNMLKMRQKIAEQLPLIVVNGPSGQFAGRNVKDVLKFLDKDPVFANFDHNKHQVRSRIAGG